MVTFARHRADADVVSLPQRAERHRLALARSLALTSIEPPAVSGIVLAGGSSLRLGQEKALIDAGGETLIERVVRHLALVVERIVLVTNDPQRYVFLGLPIVGDIYPDVGTLGGLHAGLAAIETAYGLVVGCDMPFLNPALLRYMISLRAGCDVVMPRIDRYREPLHAVYARTLARQFACEIEAGQRRVMLALGDAHICYIDREEIVRYDPHLTSFFNVNEPQDVERMRALLDGADAT
jgi:molybdopterin-guanine dinucleotide biosynthesis protein A